MAKKKQTRKKTTQVAQIQLVESDDTTPSVPVQPGYKFEVVSVSVMDAETAKPSKLAARLCGGTSTCLALIKVD